LHLRPRSGTAPWFSDASLFGRTVLTVVVDTADRGGSRDRVAAIDCRGGRGFCRRGPIATRPVVDADFASPARHPDSRRRVGRTASVASGRRAERFLGVLYFHDCFRRGRIRVLTLRDKTRPGFQTRERDRLDLGTIFKNCESVIGRRYFPDGYRAFVGRPIYSPEPDHVTTGTSEQTFAPTDSAPTTAAVHRCLDFGRWHAMRRSPHFGPAARTVLPTPPTITDV